MNPLVGIAPPMDNNEALRRIVFCFQNLLGTPQVGAPGGPIPGTTLVTTRVVATGPTPTLATQLAAARANRRGGVLRNLGDPTISDGSDFFYYGSDPAVTDATGATLAPGESIPLAFTGPIYVYTKANAPIAEYAEVYG